jgi:hypothetical protein
VSLNRHKLIFEQAAAAFGWIESMVEVPATFARCLSFRQEINVQVTVKLFVPIINSLLSFTLSFYERASRRLQFEKLLYIV